MASKLLTYDKAWREAEARKSLGYKVDVREDVDAVAKHKLAEKAKMQELANAAENRRRRGD